MYTSCQLPKDVPVDFVMFQGRSLNVLRSVIRLSEKLITKLFHLCDLIKYYLGVALKLNVLFLRNLFLLQKVDSNVTKKTLRTCNEISGCVPK